MMERVRDRLEGVVGVDELPGFIGGAVIVELIIIVIVIGGRGGGDIKI